MTRQEVSSGQSGGSAGGAGRSQVVWTVEKVRALGLTTDVATAASILGFGRTLAFDLLRTNEFPVPVLRAGRTLRVPVPGLLARLGADQPTDQPPAVPVPPASAERSAAASGAPARMERWR